MAGTMYSRSGVLGASVQTSGDQTATGLKTFDQAATPRLLAAITDAKLDRIASIQVSGRYAYVLSERADYFLVIDIARPTNPQIISSVLLPTGIGTIGASWIALSGRYAYCALIDQQIVVVDIADPHAPTVVGNLATGIEGPFCIVISGRYAYVTCELPNQRVLVLDLVNPIAPTIVGYVDDARLYNAHSLTAAGKFVYVAAGTADSFTVIDVSSPTAPTIVASITDNPRLDGARDVVVSGRYAYVTCQTSGYFTIIDIANPAAPVIVGSVNDPAGASGVLWGPRHVLVAGNYAYVSAELAHRFVTINIADPTAPFIVGSVTDATTLTNPRPMAISGRYAYVGSAPQTVGPPSYFNVFDIGAVDVSAARIGALEVDRLTVLQSADVGDFLNVRRGIATRGLTVDDPFIPIRSKERKLLLPAAAIADTMPRQTAVTSLTTSLTSGVLYLVALPLEVGDLVTTISFLSSATALVTGTHQWFALYKADRTLLGVTSDDTNVAWAADTVKSLNLAAPYRVPATALHYVGIVVTASTLPSLRGSASGPACLIAPTLSGPSTTGLTTPATAPSPAAAPTLGGIPYAYVA